MGRPGTGVDVADTIVFVCAEEGHWVGGQSINLDWGSGRVSSHYRNPPTFNQKIFCQFVIPTRFGALTP